jgi:hypothetical protein
MLPSFSQLSAWETQPHCTLCVQSSEFILIAVEFIMGMNMPHTVIWHLGCFQFGAILNNAVSKTLVDFFWVDIQISMGLCIGVE